MKGSTVLSVREVQMLCVTYNNREYENRIACVKAIRDAFPDLSLKEAKDRFEEDVLFCTGYQWDKLVPAFAQRATVRLAQPDEELCVLQRRINEVVRQQDEIYFRSLEIARVLKELSARRNLLKYGY